MRKFYCILLILAIIGISANVQAAPIKFTDSSGAPWASRWLVAEEFGYVQTDREGIFDFEAYAKDMASKTGEDVKLPGKFMVLVPTVDEHKTLMIKVDTDESAKHALGQAVQYQKGWITHRVQGPNIVDENGNPLTGVEVYCLESNRMQTTTANGMLTAFPYAAPDQKKVVLALAKPGYELTTIEVKLPKVEDPANPPYVTATDEDIVLKPNEQQLLHVEVQSPASSPTISNDLKVVDQGYYKYLGDIYYWVKYEDAYMKNTFEVFFAPANYITLGLSKDPRVEQVMTMTDSIMGSSAKKAKRAKGIPIVWIDSSGLNLTPVARLRERAERHATLHESALDDGKTKFDPKLKALFWILFLILAGGVGWIGYRRMQDARDEQVRTEENRLTNFVSGNFSGLDSGPIANSVGLLKEDQLAPGLKTLIRDTRKKIESLGTHLLTLYDQRSSFSAQVLQIREIFKENVRYIGRCLTDDEPTYAMAAKGVNDDLADQLKGFEETQAQIARAIADEEESLRALLRTLEDLCQHSAAAVKLDKTGGKIVEIETKVREALEGIQESIAPDSLRKIRAEDFVAEQQARKRAQQTGVSAADIADLKEYVGKHTS